MPTDGPQNLPSPLLGDPPDGPSQIAAANAAIAGRLNMRFANAAARDAELPNPVEGMECYVGTGSTAQKQLFTNGHWIVLHIGDGIVTSSGVIQDNVGSPWALIAAHAIIRGGMTSIWAKFQRTGSDVTPTSGGDFTNSYIGYLEGQYRSAISEWYDVPMTKTGNKTLIGRIDGASGRIELTHSTSTVIGLNSGESVSFHVSYPSIV